MGVRRGAVTVLIAVFLIGKANGQIGEPIGTARISGRLVDRLGGSIQDQPVVLNVAGSADTSGSTRTDQNGAFAFNAVARRAYELVFQVYGFSRSVVPVKVNGSDSIDVGNVVLEVGSLGGPF